MTKEQIEELRRLAQEWDMWSAEYIEDGYDLIETDISMKDLSKVSRGILSLLAQLERYREALEFYAERNSWSRFPATPEPESPMVDVFCEDTGGLVARTALEQLAVTEPIARKALEDVS